MREGSRGFNTGDVCLPKMLLFYIEGTFGQYRLAPNDFRVARWYVGEQHRFGFEKAVTLVGGG